MRLLVEVSGEIGNWHRAFSAAPNRPRLPLPFSCAAAFHASGHTVSGIHFSNEAIGLGGSGEFAKLYGPKELNTALRENDVAFFWATAGIKAVAANLRYRITKKVLLGSYVWEASGTARTRIQGLALATKFAARQARAVALMTGEQVDQARCSLGRSVPVIKFTWGIDSAFYRTIGSNSEISEQTQKELNQLLSAPYLILAGDQQRLDCDAIRLVEEFGFRLARVPQESATADWYRRQIRERNLEERVFVFERVPYTTLRFLFQNALAYVGLVDSTWQPAGWTVLCEALAAGKSAVVYEGLTTREMRELGAPDEVLVTVRHGDVRAVASACERIRDSSAGTREPCFSAADFARRILDLEHTAKKFVQDVEAIGAGDRLEAEFRVVLAHPGTQHSFHLARELDRGHALQMFYTGLAWLADGVFGRISQLLSPSVVRRLANRRLELDSSKVRRRVGLELIAMGKRLFGVEEQAVMYRRNQLFQDSIPERALDAAGIIIGVDTASWILAKRARDFGKVFILDQTTGHPEAKQAIHNAIRQRFPEWSGGFELRQTEVKKADLSEQNDASVIVIASSFAKKTFVDSGIPAGKLRTIPYGVDGRRFNVPQSRSKRPFRFVFVGTVTALKGAGLLLEAWRSINSRDAELWLIGRVSGNIRAIIGKEPCVFMKGAVPQTDLPALLHQCDVFVFPSYFEGFGLVILEAMACGLPVVTTTATAGPDLLTSGQEGWLHEPGDLQALVNTMRFCLENRDRVREMGRNARKKAEEFTWESYGRSWLALLREMKAGS